MASATFDTDSYLFVGTNNQYEPFLTLNPHSNENSHFNFAVVRFETTGLNPSGRKFLSLKVGSFITGDFLSGTQVESTSGSAVVSVVALGKSLSGSTDSYFSPSVAKRPWYNLHVHGQPVLGTFNFQSTNGDGTIRYHLDVTDTVNHWIAHPEQNFGFGLWGVSGSVELASANSFTPGHIPQLTSSDPTAPTGDEDGDGVPRLVELALGRNPDAPDAAPMPSPVITAVGGRWWLDISYPLGPLGAGYGITLEDSDDLINWAEVPAPAPSDPDRILTRTSSLLRYQAAEPARRYFRLKVSTP